MHMLLHSRGLNGIMDKGQDEAHPLYIGRSVSLRSHKQLPRPWDIEKKDLVPENHDRGTFAEDEAPATQAEPEMATKSSANSILPPTPPVIIEDESPSEGILSTPITPPPQHSPPTPDLTPPRRFLGAQPSMASTRAASFVTAREDPHSDDETTSSKLSRASPASTLRSGRSGRRQRTPLNGTRGLSASYQPPRELPSSTSSVYNEEREQPPVAEGLQSTAAGEDSTENELIDGPFHIIHGSDSYIDDIHASPPENPPSSDLLPRRGMSLRDRLKAQQMATPSTERFGDSIGWVDESVKSLRESRRFSGQAPPSTVEAMVFETPILLLKRNQTLRHRDKTDSLRSFSSPLPNKSDRNSMMSNPEASPTLHHKKVRLDNQNRWSYGSELSRSFSIYNGGVTPKAETEVIRVAIIPERRSSLTSSARSSQRHSLALSHASADDYYPPSAYHGRGRGDSDLSYRRRSTSDTYSPVKARNEAVYDVDLEEPPVIPARRSSLSAPTSVSNSRTSSFTSKSDHLRTKRIAAEKDLRKTLDRMESERLMPKLRDLLDTESTKENTNHFTPSTPPPEPKSGDWEYLRPPSMLDTPFSQPSALSASPGPVEVNEAKMVNYFPHHNESLQLIEKHTLPESGAARNALKLIADNKVAPVTPYESKRSSQSTTMNHSLSTPSTTRRSFTVDSPLRNPRRPPQPPQVAVNLPPIGQSNNMQLQRAQSDTNANRRLGGRHRSESFVKSLARNFSLKSPRNRKANQELDSKLHPFWRPRPFWDGVNDSDDDEQQRNDRGLPSTISPRKRQLAPTQNSLGIPQARTVIDAPRSVQLLSRSVSDPFASSAIVTPRTRRRWLDARRHGLGTSQNGSSLASPGSHNSLKKLRAAAQAGHRLYKVPGVQGVHFRFIGLNHMRETILRSSGGTGSMREKQRSWWPSPETKRDEYGDDGWVKRHSSTDGGKINGGTIGSGGERSWSGPTARDKFITNGDLNGGFVPRITSARRLGEEQALKQLERQGAGGFGRGGGNVADVVELEGAGVMGERGTGTDAVDGSGIGMGAVGDTRTLVLRRKPRMSIG